MMGAVEDRAHILVEVLPRYSAAQVVQILKSVRAREVFEDFPKWRKQLWLGESRGDGYFVGGVSDKVSADIIREYIGYQTHERNPIQLSMFEKLQGTPWQVDQEIHFCLDILRASSDVQITHVRQQFSWFSKLSGSSRVSEGVPIVVCLPRHRQHLQLTLPD